MTSRPSLRDSIDLQLLEDGSERVIYMSCKLGVSAPLALISAVGPILMKLDGSSSTQELKNHFSDLGVQADVVDRVLEVLDSNFYLNSDNFCIKRQQILDEFNSSGVRLAAHAGRIYPESGVELNKFIESMLGSDSIVDSPGCPGKLVGLVAPHIDYQRGSPCYAKAYQQLVNQKPDICIVIGTSHQPGKSLFQLCNKDFACPNGTLKVEHNFVEALLKGYGKERALTDELLHRREHSLELQLPFLNYFCPQTKIVPILVGSFYPYLRGDNRPTADSEYLDFVACLSATIKHFENQGSHVSIIAGVDMAHIGKNFGDTFSLEPDKLVETQRRDQIYLDSIRSLSASQMFEHIAEDYDERRMCGFSTMYTVLDVFAKQSKSHQVNLIDYRQAVDFTSQCLVSFAAIAIYESL